MNLGRGPKRKGRGKVVGKVVSHESKTWFKEDRNGGKLWGKLYSINLGRGSQRKESGESTSTDWLSSTYVGQKWKTMKNAVHTSVTN